MSYTALVQLYQPWAGLGQQGRSSALGKREPVWDGSSGRYERIAINEAGIYLDNWRHGLENRARCCTAVTHVVSRLSYAGESLNGFGTASRARRRTC